jgi:hypothetical protein
MRPLQTLLVWLAVASCAIAQTSAIDASVEKARAITGVQSARIVGEAILIGEESKPVVSSVAILRVSTKAKFVKIKARRSLFDLGAVTKIGDGEWMLVGSGKYAVEITTFDPELGIDETVIEVVLGDPEPEPEPPTPEPDIPAPGPMPPDAFDNIGQRVAKVTAGLPKRVEVAGVYRFGAKQLREEPLTTVNSAFDRIFAERASILGSDFEKYRPFVELISNDVKQRWPMSKGVLADYFDAVAVGLGGPVSDVCKNDDCMCDIHGPLSDPCSCGSACKCGSK